MEKLVNTYGIDLNDILGGAEANGNADFAKLIRKEVARVQGLYDVIAQNHTSTGGDTDWNVDAKYAEEVIAKKVAELEVPTEEVIAEEPAVEETVEESTEEVPAE